jgi:hypothetical protein
MGNILDESPPLPLLLFLISLAISGQRLEIGSDDGGHASALGLGGNFAGRGLALTERLLQSLDRD